ncbi:MAG: arsinothricin resistance N-acetyltransferase ArsN1 family B [Pseudomonadota bacterium]
MLSLPDFADGIRLATPEDGTAISEIYAPIVAETVISFETDVPNADEMAQRIETTLLIHPWLVMESSDGILGYAYGCPHRGRAAYHWSCEVSAYVADHVRRKGLGKRLYAMLLSLLRAQGFVRAHAGIVLPNTASVALHESCGFEAIGIYRHVGFKLGRWCDVGWWALALNDPPESPVVPIGWAEFNSG